MTARDLIKELLNLEDLDSEIKIYSLIPVDEIDKEMPEFELVGTNIKIDENIQDKIVYIEGEY